MKATPAFLVHIIINIPNIREFFKGELPRAVRTYYMTSKNNDNLILQRIIC